MYTKKEIATKTGLPLEKVEEVIGGLKKNVHYRWEFIEDLDTDFPFEVENGSVCYLIGMNVKDGQIAFSECMIDAIKLYATELKEEDTLNELLSLHSLYIHHYTEKVNSLNCGCGKP